MPDVAGALSQIGVARGWVLRGGDGLDEVTTACATRVAEVRQGHPNQLLTISPRDFGLDERPTTAARAASVEDNAAMVRGVLSGQAPRRGRDLVVLNAAAALHVRPEMDCSTVPPVRSAPSTMARRLAKLEALIRISQKAAVRSPRRKAQPTNRPNARRRGLDERRIPPTRHGRQTPPR